MKLIFAQGNFDPQYDNTRHNVGFTILDSYANSHEAVFTNKSKFFAHVAELTIAGTKVLLIKPTTYYNETGRSMRALVDFYKLESESDILVLHDDLALQFGILRTREQGSDAGNNGIKSLNTHIGHEYARLRVGIANSLRGRLPDADFVLSRFTKQENTALDELIIPKAHQLIDSFIHESYTVTSYTLVDTPQE